MKSFKLDASLEAKFSYHWITRECLNTNPKNEVERIRKDIAQIIYTPHSSEEWDAIRINLLYLLRDLADASAKRWKLETRSLDDSIKFYRMAIKNHEAKYIAEYLGVDLNIGSNSMNQEWYFWSYNIPLNIKEHCDFILNNTKKALKEGYKDFLYISFDMLYNIGYGYPTIENNIRNHYLLELNKLYSE